jgi:elongation factor P hydroxylase
VHQYQDLITIFNRCFSISYNTRLVKGGEEPIYLPANDERPYHAIFFAHGFYSSALHECAHWLIAGHARRQQEDFGYWYEPDGRTAAQQTLFQTVEIKPQALEWILSVATGYRFRVSSDNLNGDSADVNNFKKAIYQQVIQYCTQGLTPRAELLRNALCQFYNNTPHLNAELFHAQSLD